MTHTSLAFYRKSQTIDQLQTERPKSLSALHHVIKTAVSDVFSKLDNIEREYYQGHKAEDHILSLTPSFRDVMKNMQITQLHSAGQVDDILRRTDIFTEGMYQGDLSCIETIKTFDQRLKTFVPNRFEDIKNILCEILMNLEKYCVSFFQGKEDPYLETAYSYENKRKELSESIRKHVDRITDIIVTYRKGGLSLKLLGMHANDLARKCDCYDAPILFIFAEVCQSVRDACANITRWVELDSGYSIFLRNDLEEMQKKREELFRKVRDLREKHCQMDHRIKNTHRDIDDLMKQFQRFRNRERDIRDEVVKLRVTIEDLETELEARERERNKLRRNMAAAGTENPEPGDSEQIEALGMEIGRIRINMTTLGRQIESTSNKLKLIDGKRDILARKKSTLIKYQKLSMTQKTELILAEHELARIERCHTLLKDIYTFRISPDITKKIFHKLPIVSSRSGGAAGTAEAAAAAAAGLKLAAVGQNAPPPSNSDPLYKWIKRVSYAIGPDWPKLYRVLPFVPERADVDRDQDIVKIFTGKWRTTQDMQAMESLQRWRRFHPRANVEELKDSLALINRKDVVVRSVEMMKKPDSHMDKGVGWMKAKQIGRRINAALAIQSASSPRKSAGGLSALAFNAPTPRLLHAFMKNPESRINPDQLLDPSQIDPTESK